MAGRLLENQAAEKEANNVAEKFANSNDVVKDMGDAYDFDFSNVKMHDGDTDGIATTKGKDVYFGGEILSSSTPEANIVKGHELTHVMQQSGVNGMESVPYGTEQDFSFSGMFRGIGSFFKNLFGGGKKKDKTGTKTQKQQQPAQTEIQEPVDPEREALYQQIRDIGGFANAYIKKLSLDELKTYVDRKVQEYKLLHGGAMEGFEEPDQENRNKADISKEQLDELRTKDFFNEDINSVANTQKEQGIQNTVNENSLTIMKFSQGYYYAQLLVKNTPFGKALYKKLEDAGKTEHWERLYKGFKPVFLDEEGNFISDIDKNNHDWNMQYIRDIAGNEGTTTFANLTDELIGYADISDILVDDPTKAEEIFNTRYVDLARLNVITLTVNNAMKTDAYKKYLRSENGGVEPKSKEEWPAHIRYADIISTIATMLSSYMEGQTAKKGLYSNNFDLQFLRNDGSQRGNKSSSIDNVVEAINPLKDEYNKAKQDYLASNK